MQVNRHILLTGAGFTKNFGGFLADEMWAHIFNDPLVQSSKKLREKMLREERLFPDFDYERAYEDIVNAKDSGPEAENFTRALINAYKKIDQAIINWSEPGPRSKTLRNLGAFIKLFKGENGRTGFFFTLNQDWLIERFGYDSLFNARHFLYPAETDAPDLIDCPRRAFEDSDFHPIANEVKMRVDSEHSFYVKLHGSFHWKTADGRHLMLIGNRKSEEINHHALLNKSWDLFKSVFDERDLRLLIIGYGFRDKHINEAIIQAIQKRNLKVGIVSPKPIREMSKYLESADSDTCEGRFRDVLFDEGLLSYFNYSLEEILSGESLGSPAFLDIKKCFFDG